MSAIFRRELSAYFLSPIGYVFLAVFYLVSGFFFFMGTLSSQTTSLTPVFSILFTMFMFLIPILTMRLMSDELRQKTDQGLLTAPLSLTGLVVGKFLAAFMLLCLGVGILLIYGLVLSIYGSPDWAVLIGNLVGILLLGAAFIAIGLFISSLTENQVIAAVGSVAATLALFFIDSIASAIPVAFISKIISSLSFYTRYNEFTTGLLNISSIVFFLSVAAAFLFLTVRVFEKKRWA